MKRLHAMVWGVLCLGGPAAAQPGALVCRPVERPAEGAPWVAVEPPLGADQPALQTAAAQLSAGDPAAARATLAAAPGEALGRPAAVYLQARLDLAAGDLAAAEPALEALAVDLPFLAEHLLRLRAEGALAAERIPQAEALAARLSPTAGAVQLHRALATRALSEGRLFAARDAAARGAAAAYLGSDRAALRALNLAVAARISGRPPPARELFALWQAWPRTAAGAEALAAATAEGWPEGVGIEDWLETVERLARAKGGRWQAVVALGEARFGLVGAADYGALLRIPPRFPRKILKEIKALRAKKPAGPIAERLGLPEARALRALRRIGPALRTYAATAEAAAPGRFKGQVALEGARLARKLNRFDAATRDLLALAVTHLDPTLDSGDRADALWSSGWAAWRSGDVAGAQRAWAQLLLDHPFAQDRSRRSYYERALYWQAVAWAETGEAEAARRQWAFLRDRAPLSYYAVLAHHRLGDGRALAPVGSGAEEAGADEANPPEPGPVHPAHADAAWLWRLGLPGEVQALLRPRFDHGQLDVESARLLSAAYRATGARYQAHWIIQYRDPLDVPPTGPARQRWLAAYPRPFAQAVAYHADQQRVDPLLLWAVMRQESGFRPRVGSPAGALGLLQVLPATAKAMSRRLRERRPPRAEQLLEVWSNLRYGAAFLARVLRRYDGHLALALAAYNAGPGNVDDWLKRVGHLPGDAFVEEIPFDEARGYVRKVLRSYAAYRALYDPGAGPWDLPPPRRPVARPKVAER